MDIFTHLPASVLQWFAIFISIIIEALPFVFTWNDFIWFHRGLRDT